MFHFEPAVQVSEIHVTQLEPVKEKSLDEKPVLDRLKPSEYKTDHQYKTYEQYKVFEQYRTD